MLFKELLISEKKSVIHTLDPRVKIIVSIIYIILSIIVNSVLSHLIIIILFLVESVLAKSVKAMMKSLTTVFPFFILIFLANYFLGGLSLSLSLVYSLRLLSLVAIFSLFFLTTTPDEVAETLDFFRVPHTIALSFTLAIRFIPSTARQISEIMDAQKSRGLELEGRNFIQRIRNLLPILVPVIVLSIKKSIEVAEALEVRGLNLNVKKTTLTPLKARKVDYLYFIGHFLLLILILYLDHLKISLFTFTIF